MKYTFFVIWQWATEGHKAGDIVSRHTSLLEAEQQVMKHWAWSVVEVSG